MIKIHLSKILGEKRITQSQLARKTGIRPNTISEYFHEFAESIKFEHINRICNALDCSVSDLLEYISDEEYAKRKK